MSETKKGGATSAGLDSPLKWHEDGGKSYLASKIVALMPPRASKDNPDGYLHFIEPFAGSLAVLLANNPEGISEVVNDLNQDLSIFWKVLQKADWFYAFQRIIEATPFSEVEWKLADIDHDQCPSQVEIAVGFFVRCRQSLAGRMDSFAPLSRTRVRRGMNEQASAWLNCVEGLSAVHERLKRVVVLDARPAVEVIRQQDGPQTLFYLDPPYCHDTRATTGEYQHEMSYADHRELLEVLKSIKGKFLLSGYDNDLYRGYAQTCPRWDRHDFDLPNNSAGGETKRRMVESVWANF